MAYENTLDIITGLIYNSIVVAMQIKKYVFLVKFDTNYYFMFYFDNENLIINLKLVKYL